MFTQRRQLSTTCSRFPRQAQRLALRGTSVAHSISPLSVVRQFRPRTTHRFNSSSSKPVDNDTTKQTIKKKNKLNRVFGSIAFVGLAASAYFYWREQQLKENLSDKKLILSPAEATAKLRENQYTAVLKNRNNNGLVWRYDTNQVASNHPIEDTKSEKIYHTKEGDKLFFGVFEGHGGWNCSRYLSIHLIPYIKKHLDIAYQNADPKKMEATLQLVTNTIQNAFLSLDYEIVFRSIERLLAALKDATASGTTIEESVVTAMAGSCAILAYIDAATKDLHVACTGDSRAVLGVKDTSTGEWKAVPLSEDQTGRNENEVKRLQTEHPDEGNIIAHGRVFGGLEPTRAFGDARYKWDKTTHDLIYKNIFDEIRNIPGGDRNKTPPYVTARPEVKHHKIDKNDKFLVLATDGLWDRLSNDEVVKLVGGFLDGKPSQPKNVSEEIDVTSIEKKAKQFAYVDENASTHLIRNALGGAAQEMLCTLLSLPPPMARRFRDDITVTVVFFGEESL